MNTVRVTVSSATLWQRFHGCDPDYIKTTCHGRCCDAPQRPGGTLITIHSTERKAIEARGGIVENNLLVTNGICSFKNSDSLCNLHHTADKPFGCIASPFTMAPGGHTLIVRNRYRNLRCYEATAKRHGKDTSSYLPAYVAFRVSLVLLFGELLTAQLVEDLSLYGDPKNEEYIGPGYYRCDMFRSSWERLIENDKIKRTKGVTDD